MKPRKKQILIVVPWSENISRSIFAGVTDFVRTGRLWKLHYLSASIMEKLPPDNLDFFDGIIGRIGYEPLAEKVIQRSSCPIVNVHGGDPVLNLSQVGEDDYAVGVMAADYLYDLDLRHFAYTKVDTINSFQIRGQGFITRLAEHGINRQALALNMSERELIKADVLKLKRFQKNVGTQIGIFAADDWRASLLENHCHDAGIKIPQEIAILGVNNDPLFCQTYEVELSSIQLPMRKAGFLAGQMLDRLMRGQKLKTKILKLPPTAVVPRFSTEIFRIHDPVLKAAILIIEKEYQDSLKTGNIAKRVGVSQRSLELRFKNILGSSPQRIIRNRRINQAKKLLQDTDLRMSDIAPAVGLNDGYYFSQVFKKETGSSPTSYRRRVRGVPRI